MNTVPLSAYLVLALVLFCLGLYGALTKRNILIILISIELMLNAATINLVAFSKFGVLPSITGQVFSLFAIIVGTAEASVGIAVFIALYRNQKKVNIDEMDSLRE